MPAETRYFKNASVTVNGLTAYELGTVNTTISASVSVENPYNYMGIRVWKRSAAGVETEITSGACVAIVYTGTLGAAPAVRSATWSCPATPLSATDSIVVRVYSVDSNGVTGQVLMATFTTGQLGATSLDAATWTVYYYNNRAVYETTQYVAFYFGNSTYPSRIENFSWSTVTYTLTLNVDKSSGYVGDVFTFTGTLTQDSTPIAGATVTLYKDNVALSPSTTTDQYGNYAFQWVADTPGNHSFYAEAVW
jgi:hypothetical protein